MPERRRENTVRLQRMARAYRQSGALMAAVELGLFTAVSRGAADREAVARELDISPVNADRLVTYCLGLGLLEQTAAGFVNRGDVEDRTGPAEPAQWALDQAIAGGTGHAHSVRDVRGYFERAGFESIWDGDFLPEMLEWIRGSKPGG